MCEKQKRIEELELELSQVRRNYAESAKFEAERKKLSEEERKFDAEREKLLMDAMKTVKDMKYQPLLLITPLIVSLIALVAALAK
ncbi:TPA: hypothetical protein ACVU5C_003695 [Vibrio parahaemolyticus]|nr:hypothetical protein [Vibrio parahaemolyticus]